MQTWLSGLPATALFEIAALLVCFSLIIGFGLKFLVSLGLFALGLLVLWKATGKVADELDNT